MKVGVLIDPRLPGSADFAVAAEAREAGITTLLAKLDGEYPHQLATLERLVAIVGDDRTGNG
ncbi:MAG: hypothetical protein JWR37_3704 [Mycobacterium sp.]|nr:hypothetical protein [Mycobacterium sp.]